MQYAYEVRPLRDKPGVALISEALPSGRSWFDGPDSTDSAVSFVKFYGRAADVSIRVFDSDGKLVNEHRQQAAWRRES
jgi:hypothetical protein